MPPQGRVSNRQMILSTNANAVMANSGSNGGSTANLLLDQMNLLLGSWKGPSLTEHLQEEQLKKERLQQEQQQQQQQQQKEGEEEQQSRQKAQREEEEEERKRRRWIRDAVEHNVETCRSALVLYASAAGRFAPNLKNIAEYLADVVEDLAEENARHKAEIQELNAEVVTAAAASQSNNNRNNNNNSLIVLPSKQQQQQGSSHNDNNNSSSSANNNNAVSTTTTNNKNSSSSSASDPILEGMDSNAKCEYAFSRLDHAKEKMRQMVEESRSIQSSMHDEIGELKAKLERAETQLEYQILRMRKSDTTRMDREEFERERSLLECNKQYDRERARVDELNKENDELREKITSLLDLNAQFARQAIELGARVRVYADHNERLATHLSLVTEEKAVTERENEMIRAELLDLNRFHQLKDQFDSDKGKAVRTVELRTQRYGKGANSTRPRHLQWCGMVNRLTLTKQSVTTIVADVLMRRRVFLTDPESVPMDLSTFFRDYMAKKHGGVDCVPWCYAVDESCALFDEDVNLSIFQLVVSNRVSELIYREISRDITLLMGGCEVLDEARNNGETKLVVTLGDIVGLLVEMFPGYSDTAHRKLLETLMATVSSNSLVHYRMLFPNLEREEITSTMDGILGQAEMRTEGAFSTVFKQLFLDDLINTTQEFEDAVFDSVSTDRLTWSDVSTTVSALFHRDDQAVAEVMAMFRRVMFEQFGPGATEGFSILKHQLVHLVRRKMLLRRSLFRPPALDTAPKRAKLLLSAIGRSSDSAFQSLATEAGLSDFKAALNKAPKGSERRSFLDEENMLVEKKMRKQSLIAQASSQDAFSASFHGSGGSFGSVPGAGSFARKDSTAGLPAGGGAK